MAENHLIGEAKDIQLFFVGYTNGYRIEVKSGNPLKFTGERLDISKLDGKTFAERLLHGV